MPSVAAMGGQHVEPVDYDPFILAAENQFGREKTKKRVVWKYTLEGSGAILVPRGSTTLCVHEQRGQVCVWIEVDPDIAATEWHYFDVVGTGWEFPSNHSHQYIGTVFQADASLVWHVYERLA